MNTHSTSDRLKKLRRDSGLSLSELASRVGTSPATLSRYESGWDRFELYTLEKIASALGYVLELDFKSIKAANSPRSTAGCVKRIQRLFWDYKLKASDLKRYPQWIVERVIEYGNMEDVHSLMNIFGRRMFLKLVSDCRFQSQKTFNFWRSILEREGIKCTKKSFRRDVKNF